MSECYYEARRRAERCEQCAPRASNFCRKCQSDYVTPGTCNCFAAARTVTYPWAPSWPHTYPWTWPHGGTWITYTPTVTVPYNTTLTTTANARYPITHASASTGAPIAAAVTWR